MGAHRPLSGKAPQATIANEQIEKYGSEIGCRIKAIVLEGVPGSVWELPGVSYEMTLELSNIYGFSNMKI